MGSTPPTTPPLKHLSQQAESFSKSHQLSPFHSSIISRIFLQPRQHHLIPILHSLTPRQQQLVQFLQLINTANLQLLDSFYQHIVLRARNKTPGTSIAAYDRELGLCGSTDVVGTHGSHDYRPLTSDIVEIVDLKAEAEKQAGLAAMANYEKYKQSGLAAIQRREVCFVMVAGGKNIRYGLGDNVYKQCATLEAMPSQDTLIQRLVLRLQCLAQLIDTQIYLCIMVESERKKDTYQHLLGSRCSRVNIQFLLQISYGCLDLQGRLVIADDNKPYLHPNGNGDLWAFLQQGLKDQKTILDSFKYLQVFGVSNMLEHCFDCYVLGKVVEEGLPWATMAVPNLEGRSDVPVMYVDRRGEVAVSDPQQLAHVYQEREGCFNGDHHIFINNNIFSSQFVRSALERSWHLEQPIYRCKHKRVDHRVPLSKYKEILTFQKQLTDIFANPHPHPQTQKSSPNSQARTRGCVILLQPSQYHSGYWAETDRLIGQVHLSNMYKQWLGIMDEQQKQSERDKDYYEQQLSRICEISPVISLEGENLQEISRQLAEQSRLGVIEYPVYIAPEAPEKIGQGSQERVIGDRPSPRKSKPRIESQLQQFSH